MVEEAEEFVGTEAIRTKKQITFILISIALSFLFYFLLTEIKQTLATTFFIPLASSTLVFLLFRAVAAPGGIRLLLSTAGKKA